MTYQFHIHLQEYQEFLRSGQWQVADFSEVIGDYSLFHPVKPNNIIEESHTHTSYSANSIPQNLRELEANSTHF